MTSENVAKAQQKSHAERQKERKKSENRQTSMYNVNREKQKCCQDKVNK